MLIGFGWFVAQPQEGEIIHQIVSFYWLCAVEELWLTFFGIDGAPSCGTAVLVL